MGYVTFSLRVLQDLEATRQLMRRCRLREILLFGDFFPVQSKLASDVMLVAFNCIA